MLLGRPGVSAPPFPVDCAFPMTVGTVTVSKPVPSHPSQLVHPAGSQAVNAHSEFSFCPGEVLA